jgi:N-acetylneuraminic acid mutarotase
LLLNGTVLVAGGGSGDSERSAELFDPATETWTVTGAMHDARNGHTAILLPNGKVLVVGGNMELTPELYDPVTGTWSRTGVMHDARWHTSATLLVNGKVLVVGGGTDQGSPANGELYDPATDTWAMTQTMATTRGYSTTTLLPNGKVLVAGGMGGPPTTPISFSIANIFSIFGPGSDAQVKPLSSTELYDPASGTWTSSQ